MAIIEDFSRLRIGLSKPEALATFRSYCNHQNTLFVTEKWFQPYRERLEVSLSDALTSHEVAALTEALRQTTHLSSVLNWLETSPASGWEEYNVQYWQRWHEERQRERLEHMRTGFFPQEWVEACRASEDSGWSEAGFVPAMLTLERRSSFEATRERMRAEGTRCPVCGAGAEDLALVYIVTPAPTWEMLCGRAGWLVICETCHMHIEFFCQILN